MVGCLRGMNSSTIHVHCLLGTVGNRGEQSINDPGFASFDFFLDRRKSRGGRFSLEWREGGRGGQRSASLIRHCQDFGEAKLWLRHPLESMSFCLGRRRRLIASMRRERHLQGREPPEGGGGFPRRDERRASGSPGLSHAGP